MGTVSVRALDLELEAFEGPFDLLLTLVLRDEVPLSEVEIAEIVIAFVERLAAESPVDVEACGEFLVLVAALLELKARELLADDSEPDLEELDPDEAARELAERLAEYRRFKAGAAWLAERLHGESDRYFRLGPPAIPPTAARPLRLEDPARLAEALRRLASEPPAPSLAHMALRLPPVAQFLERFRALVRQRRRFLFDEEVDGLSRLEQAVALLALLELRKANEIGLEQPAPFEPIAVTALG